MQVRLSSLFWDFTVRATPVLQLSFGYVVALLAAVPAVWVREHAAVAAVVRSASQTFPWAFS